MCAWCVLGVCYAPTLVIMCVSCACYVCVEIRFCLFSNHTLGLGTIRLHFEACDAFWRVWK